MARMEELAGGENMPRLVVVMVVLVVVEMMEKVVVEMMDWRRRIRRW